MEIEEDVAAFITTGVAVVAVAETGSDAVSILGCTSLPFDLACLDIALEVEVDLATVLDLDVAAVEDLLTLVGGAPPNLIVCGISNVVGVSDDDLGC